MLELERRAASARGERVPAGMVLVDGLGVGDVGPVVLRDRRILAEDGILMCVVTIDSHTGEILAGPDLISRGFVHMDESRDFLDEAADRVADALETLEADHATDWGAIKKACRRALGEFVWKRDPPPPDDPPGGHGDLAHPGRSRPPRSPRSRDRLLNLVSVLITVNVVRLSCIGRVHVATDA